MRDPCGIISDTMEHIVIDTNVLVSALMSRNGASFRLLQQVGSSAFKIHLSVPLALEYEDATKRHSGARIALTLAQIDDVIDYLCASAEHHRLYFLWRPLLSDPRDDMVAELAVTAGNAMIVTHNIRDFSAMRSFGVPIMTPQEFLKKLEVNG